jgi:hypothetical protein
MRNKPVFRNAAITSDQRNGTSKELKSYLSWLLNSVCL